MQLGHILNCGLKNDKKTIEVKTENFESNVNGIFAIGYICSYPGKLKLILSGFHEGALAARGSFKYAKPDEKLRFEFTTTSKTAQEILGIKKCSNYFLLLLLMERKLPSCLKRLVLNTK